MVRHGRTLCIIIIILSLFGILDSLYLTSVSFSGGEAICLEFMKCDVVLTSSYAKIMGTPLSVIGVIYYSVLLLLGVISMRRVTMGILDTLCIIVSAGFLASLYFVYLQIFVIQALCQYCMISAVITTCIMIIAYIVRYRMSGLSSHTSSVIQ